MRQLSIRLLSVCRFFQHKFDARVYLSTWFCGADYRLIRRDNVADLIAYGFWYMSRAEMEAAGQGPLLRQCVSALESAFHINLPPGYQRGLRCMLHLWEPLRTIYRPLLFYFATEVLALLTKVVLLALGCTLHTDPVTGLLVVTSGLDEHLQGHRCWGRRRGGSIDGSSNSISSKDCGFKSLARMIGGVTKAAGAGGDAVPRSGLVELNERPTVTAHWDSEPEAAGADDSMEADAVGSCYVSASGDHGDGHDANGAPAAAGHGDCCGVAASGPPVTPVLLLHGVGLGLLPYTNLIRCLLAAGMPLVAVEYKHVSMRLCSIIPSADDIAAGAVALMDRLGLEQVCVVAHSYGTFVASRMAQMYAPRMQSLALLDPVCFGMFMPHLLANFIYRQPRTTSFDIWVKDVLFKFVSRDLHCAAALCRRFYWSDINLWPQDIPGRTLVAIGGQDQLIHVDEVLDFIQHYAAKILYHPDHSHAQLLMDPDWQQQILSDIVAMASSGGGVAGAREVERRLTSMPAKAPAAHLTPSADGEEGLPTSLAEAVATAAPGVVRRVTTQRQMLMARPPSSSLASQEHPPPSLGAPTAVAMEDDDDQEDVAALAAALSQKIGQARERESTADLPLPSPPLRTLPSAAAEASAPQGPGVDTARCAGADAVPQLRKMPPPVVPRRCTAAARLQHVSSATGPDRLLHMELAAVGLNHAVLIAPSPPPMAKPRGASTSSSCIGGVGVGGNVSPCGGLRPVLPSICESREDASGPPTPAWDAAPPPSAFPLSRHAARETLIEGAGGSTMTRRTWTT
ncbi:hypothetical protein Vretimale_2583 [Volvox reticuliferus]|uniref:Uncharacterized protein n=1 Tax=Volvox reticuliferus TaxID=1737510 RepID=A0A8J4DCB2_9CHLO|nr:hypothetical protein Vretifemale_4824 [Volvox reticuliferus]GIL96794.1 hypothetical protein Vretimale_2583 [Volvox reticuliferus]